MISFSAIKCDRVSLGLSSRSGNSVKVQMPFYKLFVGCPLAKALKTVLLAVGC